MRRLVFATQRLDPVDPVLGATVPMLRALSERVDELVVLCDAAVPGALPPNALVHKFGAATQAGRGLRFEAALARALRPRPLAVVAHMVPLYALLAAPLARPLRVPLLLWYTHWKAHAVLRAAERVCTAVVSVDRRSFPLASSKLRPIGHGIDVSELPCVDGAVADGPLRALVLGRYSPAKGVDEILRGVRLAVDRGLDVAVRCHGVTAAPIEEAHRRELARLVDELGLRERAELGGPVPHAELPALFARSDVLVNNMEAGAPDKVVYEAAASCLAVLASNPVFDDLLPDELRFERGRPESLAERLLALDRRRRPELRERVAERHSVESWAEGILKAAMPR
jgi:glycosyltransferase involved in cell wall biosynthesis